MESDYRTLPAITSRSYDFTVYPSQDEDGPGRELLEGRTDSLSRLHLRGIVTREMFSDGSSPESIVGTDVVVKFHAISSALDRIQGQIVEIEESGDLQYRWMVEIKFDRELNFLELQLDSGSS